MNAYQRHHQLAALIHELSETIDAQSRRLLELSREQGVGDLPDASLLRTTWPHLGTAFDLMAAHAQTVHDELKRLELAMAPAL